MGQGGRCGPRVKGQRDDLYSLSAPCPLREAMASFQVALRGLGFAITESDGLMKIVNEGEAKLQGGAVVATPDVIRRRIQIGTQVFRLQHESAANALTILRTLISPNNSINMSPGNNSLVTTDYADNPRRLAKIIAAIDAWRHRPRDHPDQARGGGRHRALQRSTVLPRPRQQGALIGSGESWRTAAANTVIVRAPSAAEHRSRPAIQQPHKPVSGPRTTATSGWSTPRTPTRPKPLRAASAAKARQATGGGQWREVP